MIESNERDIINMDFICDTGGNMIICHHTNTPCSPMCSFYTKHSTGYATCEDVKNSLIINSNSKLSNPWLAPRFHRKSHQKLRYPNKNFVTKNYKESSLLCGFRDYFDRREYF